LNQCGRGRNPAPQSPMAKMNTKELYNEMFAQTMRSAELLERGGSAEALTAAEANDLAKWLRGASCAALELANRKNGSPAPKRGD
jgi:hypothetical protein